MAWLRALMMATGWPALLAQLRDQRIVAPIGDAPVARHLTGGVPQYGPAGDRRGGQRRDDEARVKLGPVSSDTITMSSFRWTRWAPQRRCVHDQSRYLSMLSPDDAGRQGQRR